MVAYRRVISFLILAVGAPQAWDSNITAASLLIQPLVVLALMSPRPPVVIGCADRPCLLVTARLGSSVPLPAILTIAPWVAALLFGGLLIERHKQ